jgi:hypothetical protein
LFAKERAHFRGLLSLGVLGSPGFSLGPLFSRTLEIKPGGTKAPRKGLSLPGKGIKPQEGLSVGIKPHEKGTLKKGLQPRALSSPPPTLDTPATIKSRKKAKPGTSRAFDFSTITITTTEVQTKLFSFEDFAHF